jgi:hypothetical protein
LLAIAERQKLVCPQCGSGIDLADDAHLPLVTSVNEAVAAIRAMEADH